MKITANKSEKTRVLHIDGELTIYHAPKTREALLKHLKACGELEVDLSKVSEIDTAGAQLLILAQQEAARLGKRFRLGALSECATELLVLYNLTAFFGTTAPKSLRENNS